MAAGTKLVLEFLDSDDRTVQFSFARAKPSAGLANVKALMAGMIANTEIFARTLVSAKSAKEVTTSENVYDISDEVTLYNADKTDPASPVVRVSRFAPVR